MIEFRDVDFSYRNQRIFNGLSFTLGKAEYLVISGPARSGKTSLVQLISGLKTPDFGDLLIDDDPIEDIVSSARRLRNHRRRIGGIGGIYSLVTDRTVIENIALSAEISGTPSGMAHRQALAASSKYRLSHISSHYPDMISAVERRAAQLARAEAARKELIIADSPTDGLDEKSAAFINERLAAYHLAGAAILYLTSGPGPKNGPERYLNLAAGKVRP